MPRCDRPEQQILIVEAEIGNGRDNAHRDPVDMALRVELEGHVSGLHDRIVEAGDEGVILPMVERRAEARRVRESDGEMAVLLADVDRAVPGIGEVARIAREVLSNPIIEDYRVEIEA